MNRLKACFIVSLCLLNKVFLYALLFFYYFGRKNTGKITNIIVATFVMYFHFSDVFPHISQRLSLVDGKDSDILCGLYFEEKQRSKKFTKFDLQENLFTMVKQKKSILKKLYIKWKGSNLFP